MTLAVDAHRAIMIGAMGIGLSHFDLVVILAVSLAVQLGALAIIIYFGYRGVRLASSSERMTRALGLLVIQEAEKIRALVRETS